MISPPFIRKGRRGRKRAEQLRRGANRSEVRDEVGSRKDVVKILAAVVESRAVAAWLCVHELTSSRAGQVLQGALRLIYPF